MSAFSGDGGTGGGSFAGAEGGGGICGEGPCTTVVGTPGSIIGSGGVLEVSILRGSGGSANDESLRARTPIGLLTVAADASPLVGGGRGCIDVRGNGGREGGGPMGGGPIGGTVVGDATSSMSKFSSSSPSPGIPGVPGVSATVDNEVLVVICPVPQVVPEE